MAVRQINKKYITSDGRSWIFYRYVYSRDGTRRKYNSKKFRTRAEAEAAEIVFLNKVRTKVINVTEMTFLDLYNDLYDYQLDKVKRTTLSSYKQLIKSLEMLHDLRIQDFTVQHYLRWRNNISARPVSLRTKNGYHKFFKQLLNYGTKWHDYNFTSIYNRMEPFKDPNAVPKEMKFYTHSEFLKFIKEEDDLKFICTFEILYYCGLRRGELRGLTWDNIDFENNMLSVIKNVVNEKGDAGYWYVTTPKNRTSTRTIPMPDILVNHLKEYKEELSKFKNFNDDWFVVGDVAPLHASTLRDRNALNAEKAELKRIRIHDFRHSCASLLVNNGANIMIVAKYLGHAKIDETLNTYSHLFKESLKEIVTIINDL